MSCAAALLLAAVPALRAKDMPEVKQILFEGNRSVPTDSLRTRMDLAGGGGLFSSTKFDPFVLARDLGNLTTYYEDLGHLEASVRQGNLDYNKDSSEVTIHVVINEGPRWTIDTIKLEGNSRIDENTLMKTLGFREGAPYSPLRALDGEDRLLSAYAERSYLDARVTSVIERDDRKHTAQITYTITEGGQAHIKDISIRGLVRTDTLVVRRELTLKPGERLKLEDVATSQAHLYATGLFRSAFIAPDSASAGDSMKVIVVNLIERLTGEAGLGIGYSTEDRLRLQFEARHKNLWGKSLEAGIEASVSRRKQDVSVGFGQPWLFGERFRITERAGFTHIDESFRDFRSDESRFGFGLTRPIGRWWRLDGNYDWSRTVILQAPEGEDTGLTRTSKLSLTATYESRDNLLDSHKGLLTQASVEGTGSFLGGTTRFIRAKLESRWFNTFGRSVVAARVLGGLIRNQTSGVEVPVSERFFAGGQGSIRGFPEDRVGPLDMDGKPTGGLDLLVSSLEYRSPFLWILGATAFVDAGTTAYRPPGLDTHFSVGGGLGLRMRSPIGILRFDMAGPITKDRGEGMQITFGTGQEF